MVWLVSDEIDVAPHACGIRKSSLRFASDTAVRCRNRIRKVEGAQATYSDRDAVIVQHKRGVDARHLVLVVGRHLDVGQRGWRSVR